MIVALPLAARAQRDSVLNQYKIAVERLSGRVLSGGTVFARPTKLLWFSGKLAIIDRAADSMLTVIDASSGDLLKRFGRRGGGPAEFNGPWALTSEGNPDEYWVFDTGLRRMTRVNMTADFVGKVFAPKVSTQLQGGTEINSVQWLADHTLIGAGFLSKGLFAAFNADGKERPPIGALVNGDSRMPPVTRQAVYRLSIAVDGPRKRIAAATRYADRIAIYDQRGAKLVDAERPFSFEPAVTIVGKTGGASDVALGNDLRYGYVDIASTDAHVYALFSGRRSGSYPKNAGFGNQIHVFDWSGKLLRVMKVDSDLIGIAVDPRETMLFGVRHEPDPGVTVYSISR